MANVVIGNKAPYEPNLIKLNDKELLVVFNIRENFPRLTKKLLQNVWLKFFILTLHFVTVFYPLGCALLYTSRSLF